MAVLIHELSHILMCKLLNVEIEQIHLCAGGATIVTDVKLERFSKIMVSAAGPLANLLLTLVCAALAISHNNTFLLFNLSLGIFNLIPVKNLDGGKILKESVTILVPGRISYILTEIANYISLFCLCSIGITHLF